MPPLLNKRYFCIMNVQRVNLRFRHPARIIICGPSNSGKTQLTLRLLNNAFFENPISKIVWYHGKDQAGHHDFAQRGIVLRKGLPTNLDKDFPGTTPPKKTRILVLDDVAQDATKSQMVYDLFTKDSHHKGITGFLLTQNLYTQGKNAVDISRNASVIIFMIERRNMEVMRRFLHSCYNKRQVGEIMAWIQRESYERPYSTFTVDLDMETPERLRLRLNIAPTHPRDLTQIFHFPPKDPTQILYKPSLHTSLPLTQNVPPWADASPKETPHIPQQIRRRSHNRLTRRNRAITGPTRSTSKRQSRYSPYSSKPPKRGTSQGRWKSTRHHLQL